MKKTLREQILEQRMGHVFAKATEYEELATSELHDAMARHTWNALAAFYRHWLKDVSEELRIHRQDEKRFDKEKIEVEKALMSLTGTAPQPPTAEGES